MKDGGGVAEKLFCLPRRFLEIFHPSRFQVKLKGNKKKTGSIVFPRLKDFGVFKGRREMSRFQVVSFAISAKFGFSIPLKVYTRENP